MRTASDSEGVLLPLPDFDQRYPETVLEMADRVLPYHVEVQLNAERLIETWDECARTPILLPVLHLQHCHAATLARIHRLAGRVV
ncbi:MAG: hypothetical protein GYB21_08240 [Oceanospirillales bacterium]|nr:hypothetical protein [Oceanospirillales bacterium]